MRTTRIVSITLPPPLFEQAQTIAKEENRTMSELVREALRRYQREREWQELQAYGRVAAERAGVRTEEGVVRAIHDLRQQQNAPRRRAAKRS